MNIFKIVLFTLLSLTCTSFTHHRWQHDDAGVHTTDILEQFYPDQNAFRLLHEIPSDLRNLSYGIYPVSRGYDTARFNYNKRFNVFPHLIITPRTEHDAVHVLKLLKKHRLKFSIRSGGHCIESASLSSGYIIDLRNFNRIKPDVEKKEVYIGAGCRLGTVIKNLGKINYAIPTGTCSSVGVTGLSLGGGLGVLGRVFGLTCDSIKSITMLTASGDVIEVTRERHPDLFWAMRGAGNGSYGIVLGFTFKMHYVPVVSTLSLIWEWDSSTVSAVFQAWQAWVQTLPHNITTQLQLKYQNKKLAIEVTGLKVSKNQFTEWKRAFASLNPTIKVKKLSYLKSAYEWADRSPYPFFKSKSEIIMQPLSNEPIQTAIAFFEELKNRNEHYSVLFELEAMGGTITKGKTAFFPRKAFAWWYQVMYWDRHEQQEGALHKLRKFKSEIAPYVSPYSYANIVDYDIGDEYLNVYYGNHVDRLTHIKRKYDPHNLFRWKQSIPLHK